MRGAPAARAGAPAPPNLSARAGHAPRPDPELGIVAHYIERCHGAMQSLQCELPRLLGRDGGLHGRVHLAIDEDLAISGLAAQSGSQIDHGADGRIVEAALKADAP